MRCLVVGDPHVRVEDLAECERLLELVEASAEEKRADAVVLLGDLFHTFSLLHVEVVDFWVRWCTRLATTPERLVIALRGNHDGPHDPRPGVHALRALESIQRVTVVDRPVLMDWTGLLFLPYYRDPAAFAAECRRFPAAVTAYAHQEFDGAEYEGGYYSHDGVSPDAIPQQQVIGGHIHGPQEFGKVWYPGAPRWMTASDANRDRHLWLVEHGRAGEIVSREGIPTDRACRRIVRLEEVPDRVADPGAYGPDVRLYVDVRGPAAWVADRARAWGDRARLRTSVTDAAAPKVRESDGIGVAARKYAEAYVPRHGADPSALYALAQQRLGEVLRA